MLNLSSSVPAATSWKYQWSAQIKCLLSNCLFIFCFALALLSCHVQHVLFLIILAQTLLCKSVNIATLFLSRINQKVSQVCNMYMLVVWIFLIALIRSHGNELKTQQSHFCKMNFCGNCNILPYRSHSTFTIFHSYCFCIIVLSRQWTSNWVGLLKQTLVFALDKVKREHNHANSVISSVLFSKSM